MWPEYMLYTDILVQDTFMNRSLHLQITYMYIIWDTQVLFVSGYLKDQLSLKILS